MLDMDSVVGMVMTSDVYAGEQIIRNRLVGVGEEDSATKMLAYALKPGMRAISIFVDQDSGLTNFLKPGNRVDVLANYSREETRPVLNREDQLEWIQVPTSQLLAQNVSILAVGTAMDKNGTEEYTTVTLEVTLQEAMDINAVSWWGELHLLLRSPLDEKTIEAEIVDQKTVYAEGAGE